MKKYPSITLTAVTIFIFMGLAGCGGDGYNSPPKSNNPPPAPTPTPEPTPIDPLPRVLPINQTWLSLTTRPNEGNATESGQYYTSIGAIGNQDPALNKDTLSKWKTANGFNNDTGILKVIYFNGGDLETGRKMHCRKVIESPIEKSACYVTNFGPPPYINDAKNPEFPDATRALSEAIASDANGGLGAFATVAMEYTPFITNAAPVTVSEAATADVDTGIDIFPGDRLIITASGTVTPNATTAEVGPAGAAINGGNGFPLPEAAAYALLGKLDANYFRIGTAYQTTYTGQNVVKLNLTINDNTRADGSGNFTVTVRVERANNIKFFLFDDTQGGRLANAAALDSEGPKFVPQMCLACHGGTYNAATNSIRGASFLPFDVYSFRYSEEPNYTLAAQQETLRQLNTLVKDTTPNPTNPNNPLVNLIDGLYAGNGGINTSGSIPDNNYIPAGWQTPAPLAPNLYNEVIKPYCRGCHLGLPGTAGAALDFTSYAQFSTTSGNSQRIYNSMCVDFSMPHAEVPFKSFWKNKNAVLAFRAWLKHMGWTNDSQCPQAAPTAP